jgi:hypothetical protein
MPLFFLLVGVAFLVAALRGKQNELLDLLKADFSGANNFGTWVLALVLVGLLGYVQKLRPVSDALMALLIVVLMLSNKGFFAKFQEAVKS